MNEARIAEAAVKARRLARAIDMTMRGMFPARQPASAVSRGALAISLSPFDFDDKVER